MSTDELASPGARDQNVCAAYDQFILFGDSITQMSTDQNPGFSFYAALQQDYIRQIDVVNRGFSGYNTAHAIKVFPKFFPAPQMVRVRFLSIFFGTNDSVLDQYYQHVPLEDYKENLRAIVGHPLTRAQRPRILILTPPPVSEYMLEAIEDVRGSRTASNTKRYADACREVANSLDIPVVDIWSAFMGIAGWHDGQALPGSKDIPRNVNLENLLTDGLHPSAQGYKIMYNEFMRVIRAVWPDQAPDALPMVFPGWRTAPK
ncbi:SGNH hydrolase-type esterase domain containing protein [Elaphomyces granulatus]|jgi:lysophospholipase L1-like esterase